ncbi:heparin lyase I family protein [Cyclobacterium jeungdonense]|uniref:Heparin lyase I family protein n=1 Tax=Cyclobacterium jeungdonense TaxID=708087 RepID=A0ABT8CAR4_9BACT|nr:heparin lyase I family protein [Cyclobacterium jeungdonense]MDN3688893.1 heparin lyase I family protein [Cyclobacterium jeungdonense]
MKTKKNFLFIYDNLILTLVFIVVILFICSNENKVSAHYFQEDIPKNTLGTELWTAGHEGGDQSEWSLNDGGGEFNSGTGNSAVSSEVAHTGKYSLKMSINTSNGEGHGTRNFRWNELGEHDDLIFTQYFFFPNRIDLDGENDWFNLIQTKGVKFAPGGAGTGPDQINDPHFVLGLKVRGGAGSGGANFLSLSDLQKFWGSQPDESWEAPSGINLPVKKWVKIQMRIIQDRGNRGRILVWQDDQLIIDTRLRNTLRPEVDTNMYSINVYADKTYPTTANIYVDDVSIHLPATP